MTLKIKELKEFKNAKYLSFSNDDEEELFLTSNKIYLSDIKFAKGESVTFELHRSHDEVLYKKVIGMEERLAKTLKILDPNMISKLSQVIQNILRESKNLIYNIRSNYYGFQGDPKMFLKGNWKTIKLVNFKKEPITRDQLGSGNYQFVIRAIMSYLGPHKNLAQIAKSSIAHL